MSVAQGMATEGSGGAVERYYRWHAPVYDATRWTFLFGRLELMRELAKGPDPEHIIEAGCGTGANLARLAVMFSKARLTGIDLSGDMLTKARRKLAAFGGRVQLVQQSFDGHMTGVPAGDLVVFSYSLSMMNPGWRNSLRAAAAQLRPGGRIGVVDFAGTRREWFRRWMACNHVRLDDELLLLLRGQFEVVWEQERAAYAGLWKYVLFVGRKAPV